METDIYDLRQNRPHHSGLELLRSIAVVVATVSRRRVQRFFASFRPVLRGRVHRKSRVPVGAHGRFEGVERIYRHQLQPN